MKLMVVIDEFTRECLAIYVARRIRARDALEVFADLMERHGVPHYIRSDNGPEMIAKRLRRWLKRLGTETIYITPSSPWENGYCESLLTNASILPCLVAISLITTAAAL